MKVQLLPACILLISLGMTSLSRAETQPIYSPIPAANELFLKAREYLSQSDPRVGGKMINAREAIKLYQAAIEKDPNFALAYVEMSRAWLRLGYSNPDGASNDEIMPAAKAALARAVELNQNLPDAHLMLAGLAFNIDYEWQKADREYRQGIALQPNNADAHANYAAYLSAMGRFSEAVSQATQASALAPSAATDFVFARIYYAVHRYPEAADYCKKSLAIQDNLVVRFYLGLIYAAEKQYDRAIPELQATTLEKNGGALAGLAYAYAMAGDKAQAQALLDKLFAGKESGLIVPYRVAAVYLALGNNDKAIEWLGRSYAEHDNWMAQLNVDPVMDPLRSDPRFGELLRKMGFSQQRTKDA